MTRGPTTAESSFVKTVVLTLAADEGRITDAWAAQTLIWLATEAVPGLLDDLVEADGPG